MVDEKEKPKMTPAPTPWERLKQARKPLYRSASQAADALGIPKGTYLGLENGTRAITADRANQIAKRFRNTTPEFILYGRGGIPPQPVKKISQKIQIFYTTDTAAFKHIASGDYPESNRCIVVERSEDTDGLDKNQKYWFGIPTPDDAMAREKAPSFVEGTIIVFDPAHKPRPGHIVYALIDGQEEAIIREYTEVAGPDGRKTIVLRAFNQAYAHIPLKDGDRISGVKVGCLLLDL